MSRAFRAAIRSREGLVRKSALIKATLNNDESMDSSMIILPDLDSCCKPAARGYQQHFG